jgi:hypothetical protein
MCPNCGRAKHGEESAFARDETPSAGRGGLDDWLSAAVWFMALVILGVGVLWW